MRLRLLWSVTASLAVTIGCAADPADPESTGTDGKADAANVSQKLEELTRDGELSAADVDALFAVAQLTGIRRYETVARRSSEGLLLLWEGDSAYDGVGALDDGADAGPRHRLHLGALPWVYTRAD